MKTILSNGCDYSFMVHPNDFIESPKNPEKAFPGVMRAELYAAELVSIAKENASNDYIYRTTIRWINENYFQKKRDPKDLFVLINWSDPERREYYWDRSTETQRINWPDVTTLYTQYWSGSLGLIKGGAKIFWDLYQKHASLEKFNHVRWLDQIVLLQSFLSSRNINYLMTNTSHALNETYVGEKLKLLDQNSYFETIMLEELKKLGYDLGGSGHATYAAHEVWAEKIIYYLRKMELLTYRKPS